MISKLNLILMLIIILLIITFQIMKIFLNNYKA